jgi:ketosteroid isomerase-like protein
MTIALEILQLSLDKFHWKTTGQIGMIEDLFDDELIFIHITGQVTTKAQWIGQLKSKSLIYNRIDQKEAAVKVYGDTAVLVGKANFTVNGGSVYKLIYTEVYARKNNKWKLANLHTTPSY